ncbi:hypothetical protein M0R45_012174 [Rubus argutus]|uniref:Uncharacterized protein n=1 Tax=Rubus argutus TaxID=59490 RepID=A0AAW1YFJ2_RUBAR
MEGQDLSPPHVDASRPSLGFPLGTALLLIIIFSLNGIFSCCYHWDKLRSLRRSFAEDSNPETTEDIEGQSPSKSKPDQEAKRAEEKIVVKVQKQPKPPRFPVPLY